MTQNLSEPSGKLSLKGICAVCGDVIAEIGARTSLSYPIHTELLREEVQRRFEPTSQTRYPVILRPKFWEAKRLAGKLYRYETHAEIVYSREFGLEWRRFVIAKELAHLLLDNQETYTYDPISLVQSLINAAPNLNGASALRSEYMAPFAAVELLLPWSHRAKLYEMEQNGVSHGEIADYCCVPEKLVTMILTEPYRGASEAANIA